MDEVLFVVEGPVRRAEVPALCDRLAAVVRARGARVVTVDATAMGGPGADALQALARLRLTARRLGVELRFVGLDRGLVGLLGWLGLGQVVGEAEEGEEPGGVEEGVDARDPPV
ncbi:STAS domain-containing protein [Streptomyces sp. DSM 44915]|uniref:STAS domain-containing protein n=1 Tax=Streptomyces chisholmiae TaxID=3075540 RepID=A0ABU2JSV6_9ACTN|nr:STAS domain-containing protein [Streptomyces sp. DSM 44915]MDT0268075.1 STAS domain-containing protein [Streptomyces sp. DSM 44915]